MLVALLLAASCPVPAGWDRPAPVAVSYGVRVGQAATIALSPSAAKPGTFEGVTTLTLRAPGRYAVSIDRRAWIDLIRDGKPVPSVDHRHGDPCTGIAKTVVFALTPGSYTAKLEGSPAASVKILVSAE